MYIHNYILYKINKIEKRAPDLNDVSLKNEILELINQKNKFDYNNELFERIKNNRFDDNDFEKMGDNKTEKLFVNSIKDNKKFDINSIELLYSLPIDSFTLINDDNNDIYLVKIKDIINYSIDNDDEKFKEYTNKENTNTRRNILKSYDLLLNEKYNVVLNQKTIERVKNFFK